MSGVNLLDQLKAKKVPDEANLESGGVDTRKFQNWFEKFKGFSLDSSNDLRLFIRFFIMAAVLGTGYYLYLEFTEDQMRTLQTKLEDVQQKLDAENAKKAKLKSILAEMQGYQAKVDELKAKLAVVNEKDLNRAYLVKAFEYVATEMPRDVWFTDIDANRGDGTQSASSQIKFIGYALSPQAVSEFLTKLDLSVYFPSAKLEDLSLVDATSSAPSGTAGAIPIPFNSRRFSIVAKMGD